MFAKLRPFLRFDLATLICFVLALNFMVFVNWQTRSGRFVVLDTAKDDRVVYRPTYWVGWPLKFLRLNGIKERKVTNTEADRAPLVEVTSWKNAVLTVGVNVLIAFFATAILTWLLRQFRSRPATAKRGVKTVAPTP